MTTNSVYWIWLGISLGYDSRSLKPLIDAFGDAAAVYAAGTEELNETTGVSPANRKSLLNKDLSLAEEVANYCLHKGVGVLTYSDERYPLRLKSIPSPPAVLYYRGHIPDFTKYPAVCMVGTRSMSHYGASVAYETAYDLGRMGCITVSGMALGIDGVAAAATLAAGGTTVAVLGSGIDRIYPYEHVRLYRSIIENGGLVLTECPPYESPERFHFPLRNRIIAGLSDSVIMVEGDHKSGALITSEIAMELGRDVYAVPGNVYEINSEGPHILLSKGAHILVSADAIYDKYKETHYGYINGFTMQEERHMSLEEVIETYDVHCATPKTTADFSKQPRDFLEKRRKIAGRRGRGGREEKEKDASRASASDGDRVLRAACRLEPIFTDASFDEEAYEKKRDAFILERLDGIEQEIYRRLMPGNALHAEELADGTVPFGELTTILVMMETNGYIESLPGDFYRKTKG